LGALDVVWRSAGWVEATLPSYDSRQMKLQREKI